MADIYDRSYALAVRMLAPRANGGKGAVAVFTTVIDGAYDPATGTTPQVTTNYTGSAFRDTYKRMEIDGSRVLASDVKFLVSPELADGSATPLLDPQYKLNFDGATYNIVSVMPWNYAGLAVGYEVQARLQ